MSQEDYYNDSSQWGQYSYVTLEQIVNDYLAIRDQDDYTFNTPRYKVVYQAKRALRELYYDVLQEVKAIELDLKGNLQVVLPEDFVDYVRISFLDDNGVLHPIAQNNGIPLSLAYLQDNDNEILFDNEGAIIYVEEEIHTTQEVSHKYTICSPSFNPNLNRSNMHPNGSYRLDKDNGVIKFTSDLVSKTIVLEYISDGLSGLDDATVRVHKFAEQALLDAIFYQLIKNRRNIPAVEKHRARKEYFNSRRIAKRRINSSTKDEWLQAMKGSSVWIKD